MHEHDPWFFRAMDFLGEAPYVKYPRWLRRTYILTWPIAAPVRYALFAVGMIVFFLVLAVLLPIAWLLEKLCDIRDHIYTQWSEQ